MDRKLDIGDRVINSEKGWTGTVINFSKNGESTHVRSDDGHECIAPTWSWNKYSGLRGKRATMSMIDVCAFDTSEK